MKVKLKCGDTITIPEGCKAIVKDGSVVFEKEEKEKVQEFKEGDVLTSIYDGLNVIFKETEVCGTFVTYYNPLDQIDNGWRLDAFRHATEEEKAELFAKMKEQGLKWNAEEKRVEKIRWRAKEGEEYSYVNSNMEVSSCRRPKDGEYKCDYEGNSYHSYNYFRTQEQTTEAAKRVKETLRKYHEEIGE